MYYLNLIGDLTPIFYLLNFAIMKIIFVTGWTVSGLWKWVVTASISKLLQSAWLKIWVLKMDPYLQVDAWTMSPYEHWECYVTDDWAETDLDLWNYERFLWISLKKENNITTGQVYLNVINKERAWEYLGQTVQIIPHITNEIKDRILQVAKDFDITLIEVWWTVWDIESAPFLEAIRQLKRDLGRKNVFYIHLSLLLELTFSGEIKTKPIQHTIIKLREYWITADMLICRTWKQMDSKIKEKISMLCDIDKNKVIEWKNVATIYRVPEELKKQNVWKIILDYFSFDGKKINLDSWNKIVKKIENPKKEVTIAIVWKYTKFDDTYKSILESFTHAWANLETKVNINFIESDELENPHLTSPKGEEQNNKILEKYRRKWKLDAILVPWWFWKRGIEWMINAISYARKNDIPFLWICLWMQLAVIEFARNVCGLKDANSSEFDKKTQNKVIDIMENQKNIKVKWWTMRLWAYKAILESWSLVEKLYTKKEVFERHRHRYEVNPKYHNILENNWLNLSWKSEDKKLVEFVENNKNTFFIATQAHPEFKSSLEKPHPLFVGLIRSIK